MTELFVLFHLLTHYRLKTKAADIFHVISHFAPINLILYIWGFREVEKEPCLNLTQKNLLIKSNHWRFSHKPYFKVEYKLGQNYIVRSCERPPYMAIFDRPADWPTDRLTLTKSGVLIGRKKGCCIVEDVIGVDEFYKVDICCSRKIRQIRKGWAELFHT